MEPYLEILTTSLVGLIVTLIGIVGLLLKKQKGDNGHKRKALDPDILVQRLDRLEAVLSNKFEHLEAALNRHGDRHTEQLTDIGKNIAEMKGTLARINGGHGRGK